VMSVEFQLDVAVRIIGPRQEWQDFTGDWARARDVRDSGALLVRPDQHVAWRCLSLPDDAEAELRRVFTQLLARSGGRSQK
jgi:2,4-dichlorophenol 6-monooxygenase